MTRVILASESPRRLLLLPLVAEVERSFAPMTNESRLPGESGLALAVRLAAKKARAAALAPDANNERLAVLAADTVVRLGETPLGKPRDAEEAFAMLRALRGRSHTVVTAVAVLAADAPAPQFGWVSTTVRMRAITDGEIRRYVERGEPFDKAGGYAIQDTELCPVEALEGCFPNVVGLPLCAVEQLLDDPAVEGDLTPSSAPCSLCSRAADTLRWSGFWAPSEL